VNDLFTGTAWCSEEKGTSKKPLKGPDKKLVFLRTEKKTSEAVRENQRKE